MWLSGCISSLSLLPCSRAAASAGSACYLAVERLHQFAQLVTLQWSGCISSLSLFFLKSLPSLCRRFKPDRQKLAVILLCPWTSPARFANNPALLSSRTLLGFVAMELAMAAWNVAMECCCCCCWVTASGICAVANCCDGVTVAAMELQYDVAGDNAGWW